MKKVNINKPTASKTCRNTTTAENPPPNIYVATCDQRGWNASAAIDNYGISYGRTYYGGEHAQTTGTAALMFPGGSFRLENDFLRFNGQDRWRTSAWELTVGDFSLGSSIYTNDPKGMESGVDENMESPMWGKNRPIDGKPAGGWVNGQVYSSPLWIGYRSGNTISRIGYSHQYVQDATQNFIHKWMPGGRQQYYLRYDDFRYGWYGYSGYYNSFSFY